MINDHVVTDISLMKHSQYGKSRSIFESAATFPGYKKWMDEMDQKRDPRAYYSKMSFNEFELGVKAAKAKREQEEREAALAANEGAGSSRTKKSKKRQESGEVAMYRDKKKKSSSKKSSKKAVASDEDEDD